MSVLGWKRGDDGCWSFQNFACLCPSSRKLLSSLIFSALKAPLSLIPSRHIQLHKIWINSFGKKSYILTNQNRGRLTSHLQSRTNVFNQSPAHSPSTKMWFRPPGGEWISQKSWCFSWSTRKELVLTSGRAAGLVSILCHLGNGQALRISRSQAFFEVMIWKSFVIIHEQNYIAMCLVYQ